MANTPTTINYLEVDDAFDADGDLGISVAGSHGEANAWLNRAGVEALRDHLNGVLAASEEHVWALGWYRNKRHVASKAVTRDGIAAPTICSRYTSVYPAGYANKGYPIPAGNTPEVLAKPACKLCERKIAQ